MIKGYLGKVHVFRSLALVRQVVSIKHVQYVNEDFLLLALNGFCLGWGGGGGEYVDLFHFFSFGFYLHNSFYNY